MTNCPSVATPALRTSGVASSGDCTIVSKDVHCKSHDVSHFSIARFLKAAAVGMLYMSGRALGAMVPPRAALGSNPVAATPPEFLETIGCEYEVLGTDAAAIDATLQGITITTLPPLQLSYADAARLSVGMTVSLPDKGCDAGFWRVVPELAFPLDTHEVISPALLPSEVEQINHVGDALARAGHGTNGDGAFHVHVGHANLTAAALADLALLWGSQQDVVYALANTNLRQRQLYARPLEPAFLQLLDSPAARDSKSALHAAYRATHQRLSSTSLGDHAQRFYSLNLHYVGRGHTVEFRPYQFAGPLNGTEARAFVDLSLALVAAARDGRAPSLAACPIDPASHHETSWFLDALGLTEAAFGPSRAALLANIERPHGFALFGGEGATALREAALLAISTVALARLPTGAAHRTAWWFAQAAGLLAEGVILTTALHSAALAGEYAGWLTYAHTYGAREWTLVHMMQAGLVRRGLVDMLRQ